jgi:hypothetical protein
MAKRFIDDQHEGRRGPEGILPPTEIDNRLQKQKAGTQGAVNTLLSGLHGETDLDEALETIEDMTDTERLLKTGKVATLPVSEVEVIAPEYSEAHENVWRNQLAQYLDTSPKDIVFKPLTSLPNRGAIRVLPKAQRDFKNVQGGELFESLQNHDLSAQQTLARLVEVRSKTDQFEEFYMQQEGRELVPVSKPFTFVQEDRKLPYHDCPRLNLDDKEPINFRTFIGTYMTWEHFQRSVREHFPKDQYPQVEVFSLGDPGSSGPILRLQQADGTILLKSAAQLLAGELMKRVKERAAQANTVEVKPTLLQKIRGLFG